MPLSSSLHGFIDFLITNNLLVGVSSQQIMLAVKQHNTSPISYLINHALLETKTLATAAAQYFGLKFVDLDQYEKSNFALEILNHQLIIKYRVLPIAHNTQNFILAISDPSDALALNAIKFHTARAIEPVVVEHDKLERWIEILLEQAAKSYTTTTTAKINATETNPSPKTSICKKNNPAPQDDSIINLVDRIFAHAIAQHASDIHFEPYTDSYRVRLRIDGILYLEELIDINLAQRLSSRLKVMANLDIAERRLPQDGRFTLKIGSSDAALLKLSMPSNSKQFDLKQSTVKQVTAMHSCLHEDSKRESQNLKPNYDGHTKFDCRMSTCPTMCGEKIVVRILNPSAMDLDLTHTGLTTMQQQLFLTHINAPQGMILVTGPTGSGKTVTLYTALTLLNTSDQNISTVEDPIEINLHGINQVEVNPKIGLNFATVLRTFLRQDPDIIMLGEIRDQETAQIAIKAAQTGHLVLSTLHTNSAAETITRLLNMDIASFNIVGVLQLLIAQRLVRKLCTHCKEESPLPTHLLAEQNSAHEITTLKYNAHIFKARPSGCQCCKNGYLGRSGIFELLPISPTINTMILEHRSALDIERQACLEGMATLRTTAWQKVLTGETSLEEINRVVL